MKELIAYCGLDCEKCDARLATICDDAALRGEDGEALVGAQRGGYHAGEHKLHGLPGKRREDPLLRRPVPHPAVRAGENRGDLRRLPGGGRLRKTRDDHG